jgi:dethiobiotin synthetase
MVQLRGIFTVQKPLALFVTGTSTNIGKTVVTGHLARFFDQRGWQVTTQKWVQCGSVTPSDIQTHDHIRNHTADRHLLPLRCPYCFTLAASPHLAAHHAGVAISGERLIAATQTLRDRFDMVLIEGSGGIAVPVTEKETTLDVLGRYTLPTLVVAANQLGTVNHTLLTVAALRSRQIPVIGVVLNGISDVSAEVAADNPLIIEALSGVPVLASLSSPPSETEIVEMGNRILARMEEHL